MRINMIDLSSNRSVEYVKQHISDIGKIKKILCYFSGENFLLTPYDMSKGMPTLILETQQDEIFGFKNLNCGYNGQGPNATQQVLIILGVEENTAKELIKRKSFCINFETRFKGYYVINHQPCLFNDLEFKISEFKLGENCSVDTGSRQVYLLNPQLNNPSGFYAALCYMKPVEMTFCLGNHRISDINIDEKIRKYAEVESMSNKYKCNLIIVGELFSLYCYVTISQLRTLIQSTYLFLKKKPLFLEKSIGIISTQILINNEVVSGKYSCNKDKTYTVKLSEKGVL